MNNCGDHTTFSQEVSPPPSASGFLTHPSGWGLGDQYRTVWGGGIFFLLKTVRAYLVSWGSVCQFKAAPTLLRRFSTQKNMCCRVWDPESG